MVIIKDKFHFWAILLGTLEKVLIFLLFIFPLRAIKSVIDNKVGRKLELLFNFFGIKIDNQTDLTFIFAITFILLLVSLILVNRVRAYIISYIKKNLIKYKKNSTLQKNLKKLNDIDYHIDIRIYTTYGAILFLFLIFYDFTIAALIILGGFISFFQYRRLEKSIEKESISLELNKLKPNNDKKKYEKTFLKNILLAKYRESKLIIKATTNTITMISIMYVIFFREDKSSTSIIFIFLTRLLLNQVDQIISKYQRKKNRRSILID